MSIREEPFYKDSIYHVFNKTIDERKIFSANDFLYSERFLDLALYYRSQKATISYSDLKKLDQSKLKNLLGVLKLKQHFKINLLAYTLMPNHFHLLLQQKKENGIVRFISDIENSLTKFFNLKNDRRGPIFLPKFKAVMIRTDRQLVHVSRYIHLNIMSVGLVNRLEELRAYRWTSYSSYIFDRDDDLVDTEIILKLFNSDKKRYQFFVESNSDYQKFLETIKKRAKRRRKKYY